MERDDSRLLQKLRAQHQALDLVGAALDLVFVIGEMNVPDHGAALEHCGGALQLQVLDQRNTVALGEQRAAKEKPVPAAYGGATLLPASETTRKEAEFEPTEKQRDDLNVDAVFAKLKNIGGKKAEEE